MSTGMVYCLGNTYRIRQSCLKNKKLESKEYTIRVGSNKRLHNILRAKQPDCDCTFQITNECDLTTLWSRESGSDKMVGLFCSKNINQSSKPIRAPIETFGGGRGRVYRL